MKKPVVDLNMFIAIKTLLRCGEKQKRIAEQLHVSEGTVQRVNQAESLEEYRQQMCAVNARCRENARKRAEKQASVVVDDPKPVEPVKAPEKAPEVPKTVIVQASHYMLTEQQKTNETLELVSRKLTALLETMDKLLQVWQNA